MPTRSLDKDPINQGLLLSIPMREGTGSSVVADVARPHHPITQVHAPSWTQLSNGLWCLDFDGASDYLRILNASAGDLNFTASDFSGCMWIYPHSASGERTFFSMMAYNARGWAFETGALTAGIVFWTCQAATHQESAAVSSFAANQWFLIGFTRAGSSARIYVSGIDSTTTAGTHTNPVAATEDFNVAKYSNGGAYFNGPIWNPRVWGRALSPAEHRQLFQRERHLFNV